jgi:Fe-S cluster assembly scaffold protein SufB
MSGGIMDNKTIKVNRIPSLTWNWLHMNETVVSDVESGSDFIIEQDIPSGVSVRESEISAMSDEKTGIGKELSDLIGNSVPVHEYIIEKNEKPEDPVRLEFNFKEKEKSVSLIDIYARENSESYVIMTYRSEKEASNGSIVQTRYHIAPGAILHLIQVQMLGSGFRFINDIGGTIENDGSFDLIQLILGGHESYYGAYNTLSGKKSNLNVDIAYDLGGDSNLDMNYVAYHTGKKSVCNINADGVLRDKSKKLFRGTIDFRRGSAGAKGDEMENVLLLSDTIGNRTIPVILCDEEDVEGNHGASIGRLDDSLMFYLESRGLDPSEVNEMMARARVDAVADRIRDSKTRDEIRDYLDKK